MRLALATLVLLLLPIANAAPADLIPECNAGVCVEVDSFNGDCNTFHMEYVRILVPSAGIVIHSNRWCGADFTGMRADVMAGNEYVAFVWYSSGGECETYILRSGTLGSEYLAPGCPAGAPPALPPVLGLLP